MSRKIDIEIARDIFGWVRDKQLTPGGPRWITPEGERQPLPHYSTDIYAAMLVVEHLRKKFTNFSAHASNGWGISLGYITSTEEKWVGPFTGDTFEEAVCNAALATKGDMCQKPQRK